jgi:hypothetical protein
LGLLEEWVDGHPLGTPLVVRYDPVHDTKVELVATDMPLGGPQTPSNVKRLVSSFFGDPTTCGELLFRP